jgi:hypothetical protein
MLRTSVRCLLLFALTAVPAEAGAPAPEEKASGQALEYQKKLAERIPTYGIKIQTTLDRALEDVLHGVPYIVNELAFGKTGVDKPGDILKTTQVDPFEINNVSRATILKRLLTRVPSTAEKGVATYVIRRDSIEITTWEAYQSEFFPHEDIENWQSPLPLVCAEFSETPLADALKEIARTGDSNILLDGRIATEAKTKITADLVAVPVETAVRLLADMAGVKLVRLGNVYYVTSKENARVLQDEEDKARLEKQKRDMKAGEDSSPPKFNSALEQFTWPGSGFGGEPKPKPGTPPK